VEKNLWKKKVRKYILKMFNLKKKLVVISGGLGRIGIPMTTALLEKEADVIVLTKNTKKHLKKIKDLKKNFSNFKVFQCDVSNIKSLKKIIKQIDRAPDVFIFSSVIRPLQNKKLDDFKKWNYSINRNASSLNLTSTLFSEIMKKNGSGSIIIISSIYGLRAPDHSLYSGTKMFTESDYPFLKGGTIIYSNYMASKLGKYNIRFNVIAPGGLNDDYAEAKFKKRYIKKVPLGRMLEPNDLKGVVVFLSSDESSYITGCTIRVDGGICL
jgi:NAD(P)-dependent dehydrogenase (short-subunit alcohol dehydrogenase family)